MTKCNFTSSFELPNKISIKVLKCSKCKITLDLKWKFFGPILHLNFHGCRVVFVCLCNGNVCCLDYGFKEADTNQV